MLCAGVADDVHGRCARTMCAGVADDVHRRCARALPTMRAGVADDVRGRCRRCARRACRCYARALPTCLCFGLGPPTALLSDHGQPRGVLGHAEQPSRSGHGRKMDAVELVMTEAVHRHCPLVEVVRGEPVLLVLDERRHGLDDSPNGLRESHMAPPTT